MTPKVAWIPAADINRAGSRLRAFLPCRYLKQAGYDCEIFKSKNSTQYDLVIFQKAYSPQHRSLAETLQCQGVKIALDLCDNDLYELNNQTWKTRGENLKQFLSLTDAVSVATEALSQRIPHLQTTIIDDAFDAVQLNQFYHLFLVTQGTFKPLRSDCLKLIWFGNKGRRNPLSGLICLAGIFPILEKLNHLYALSLTIVSDSQTLAHQYTESLNFPVHYYPWSRTTFPYVLRQHDICLIPNNINPYTVCKTNNRLLLSLRLGVPVIADEIPSYSEFKDFALFSNWFDNLVTYAVNPELRKNHVIQGQEYIRSHYTRDRTVRQWIDFIHSIV